MIPTETVDKIFSTIRIEEIIGEYVQLKRAGSNFKGLSPFQDEKSPSFIVSPSKGIWKDFSSGKGGSAITFLMEIEKISYPEALRYAAKKYGIEINEEKRYFDPEQEKIQSQKEQLYKIHEVATNFFASELHETTEGKTIALSYFKERGLSNEIIEKFQLGYSPEKKDAFTSFALEKGYTKEILESSGLSVFPNNAPSGVDRFRERVIFPIHNYTGRVLGFGARILKNNVKTAKYLNSPETSIYHKSDVLYGFYQSKQEISKLQQCLLVEGYMDVIALHQAGIANVVASSGTALTISQIKLIKRLTDNVTILFDGDQAGIKASFRSIDLLLSEGMNIRVLLFPDGHDPDSFSRTFPLEHVQEYIQNETKDFIEFKSEILFSEAQGDPIKKAEAIRNIVRSISQIPNDLKKEVLVKEIANRFQLSEQSLFNELGTQNQSVALENKKTSQKTVTLEIQEATPTKVSLHLLESKLVTLMLRYGDQIIEREDEQEQALHITVIEDILHHFQEDNYEIILPENKRIVNEIAVGIEKGELRTGNYFIPFLDEEISAIVTDALIEEYQLSDWEKHNIYFKKEIDLLPKIIEDTKIRHKREFIMKMIKIEQEKLVNSEGDLTVYEKIVKLNQLKNQIDKSLYRIL